MKEEYQELLKAIRNHPNTEDEKVMLRIIDGLEARVRELDEAIVISAKTEELICEIADLTKDSNLKSATILSLENQLDAALADAEKFKEALSKIAKSHFNGASRQIAHEALAAHKSQQGVEEKRRGKEGV